MNISHIFLKAQNYITEVHKNVPERIGHFKPQDRDPRGLDVDTTYWASKEKTFLINLLKRNHYIIKFL